MREYSAAIHFFVMVKYIHIILLRLHPPLPCARSYLRQVFLPAATHSSNGVARTILYDDSDAMYSQSSAVAPLLAFLDSDGIISFNGPRSR